ncbi:hypothetical protein RF11_14421 [Thelohanellus kitauei]|uniref:Uncharacterized protein n=1 Tax=Thelohanellus kitauei TaxID=669202 RepID=A0A0C2MLM4_THEKT|nr:hypothetical protein RF11_14421 [Thelohanellus kitauei]
MRVILSPLSGPWVLYLTAISYQPVRHLLTEFRSFSKKTIVNHVDQPDVSIVNHSFSDVSSLGFECSKASEIIWVPVVIDLQTRNCSAANGHGRFYKIAAIFLKCRSCGL